MEEGKEDPAREGTADAADEIHTAAAAAYLLLAVVVEHMP